MCKHGAQLIAISLAFFTLPAIVWAHDNQDHVTDALQPSTLIDGKLSQPQCDLNQTLYTCSSLQCCQSQSEVLVEQLKQIKTRFQGVDSIIQKDYQFIKSIIDRELNETQHDIFTTLGTPYSLLHSPFNVSLTQLYLIYLGNGKAEDHSKVMHNLATDILKTTFSNSIVSNGQYPRTIKGIKIFWQLNSAQRGCVVDYMIESTDFGVIVQNITENMKNIIQSAHEYMSLLGSMVRIIQKMVTAQETNNCINEIVNMQQCSVCTEKPVCSMYYHQLLGKCVPQLEDLYSRWDSLMTAMSVLTLRLCEHSLVGMFDNIVSLSAFIKAGNLDHIIYQHGVLAYMKCVQPDSHKRSIAGSYGSEEQMGAGYVPYSDLPKQTYENQFVFHEGGSLIKDMKVVRRSITDIPVLKAPSTPPKQEKDLSTCRSKLGLSFPPLDLGSTTWLNITVSNMNYNCWNGSAVGEFIVDELYDRSTVLPEALAIQELDEKVCRYTSKVKADCNPKSRNPPLNNSHHGPTVTQVLASIIASVLYCC